MKKKILSICLTAVISVMAIAGASLAYLTDTDSKDNTFTVGNVEIELKENFGDNNPETTEKLFPATGSAQNDTLENGVKKEVSVKNTGSEDAYVRVHIAIPNVLDNGDPDFNASKNPLHFNYSKDSIGEGKWDWSKTAGAEYEGDWNYYETTIDNIEYNVYVVTYGTALTSGQETAEKAMKQVYLDSGVNQEQIAKINKILGATWEIKVVAEGVQAKGFDNAYEALNTAFGVPGNYTVDFSGAEKQ